MKTEISFHSKQFHQKKKDITKYS